MSLKWNKSCAAIALAALLAGSVVANAQTSASQAKAAVQRGTSAMTAQDYKGAEAEFRKAIELDPDLIEAHTAFINAVRMEKRAEAEKKKEEDAAKAAAAAEAAKKEASSRPAGFAPAFSLMSGPKLKQWDAANVKLKKTYEAWEKKYPTKPAFPWVLATLASTPAERIADYKKAIALDPKFIPAYKALAEDCDAKGDFPCAQGYLKKATEEVPGDPVLAFQYAVTYRFTAPATYERLMADLVRKFPNNEMAVQAAYYLADDTASRAKRTEKLEALRKKFAGNSSRAYQGAMRDLANLYTVSDPTKALALALQMKLASPGMKDWDNIATYETQLVAGQSLIQRKEYAQATEDLSKVKVPWFIDNTTLSLLKAEAEWDGGNRQKAYDALASLVAAQPNDVLQTQLEKYGTALKKKKGEIAAEIWKLRQTNAKPFKPFELVDFRTGKKVRLEDYRGRVVLVNFWYPTCGACRDEFPYFRNILKKYRSQGFEILGVNTQPSEDNSVLPMMDKGGFSDFVQLKVPNANWANNTYFVNLAPSNFLLDANGKTVFEPRVHDVDTQHTMEEEIATLLAHAPKYKATSGNAKH